jgi:TrmH family RNA methyltransferase
MQPVFPGTRSLRIVQSRQNARVKELRAGFANTSKTEQGRISIEGQHLLAEAILSGLRPTAVFVSLGAESLLDTVSIPGETEIIALPPDVFASAAVTDSPQGIAALVEPPIFTLEDALVGPRNPASPPPLVLVLAGLQDPGNLGTLIRSAEAFGATGVITLPGTVSLWNQKALRASSGSIFRLPVIAAHPDELFAALAQHRIPALAAVATDGESLVRHDLSRPAALILGNEGSGIPPEILRRADARLTIPCPGPVESLNAAVAGSILLYEASAQRAGESSRQRAGEASAQRADEASRQRARETAKAGQP